MATKVPPAPLTATAKSKKRKIRQAFVDEAEAEEEFNIRFSSDEGAPSQANIMPMRRTLMSHKQTSNQGSPSVSRQDRHKFVVGEYGLPPERYKTEKRQTEQAGGRLKSRATFLYTEAGQR